MNRTIKTVILILTLIVAFGTTGCTIGAAVDDDKIILRLANPMATGDNVTVGLDKFKELVEKKSEGAIEIQHYPNAVLGSDRATTEQCQGGSIEMSSCSSPNMASFVPEMMAFDLPYITSPKYQQQLYDALDHGELGQYYKEQANKKGLEIIMFSEFGYRNFATADSELTNLGDLQNLKLRTTDSQVEVAVAKALGATPMPIAWGETYTSLQQGSVDGEGNTYSLLYNAKHHEALDYMIDSEHNYSMHILVMNKDYYDALPVELQELLTQSALEATEYQREVTVEISANAEKEIANHGVEIYKLTDEEKQAFKDATKGVWEQFPDKIPQKAIDLITETQK